MTIIVVLNVLKFDKNTMVRKTEMPNYYSSNNEVYPPRPCW